MVAARGVPAKTVINGESRTRTRHGLTCGRPRRAPRSATLASRGQGHYLGRSSSRRAVAHGERSPSRGVAGGAAQNLATDLPRQDPGPARWQEEARGHHRPSGWFWILSSGAHGQGRSLRSRRCAQTLDREVEDSVGHLSDEWGRPSARQDYVNPNASGHGHCRLA